MKLDPEFRKEVEAATDTKVPPPTDEAFGPYRAWLETNYPELARRIDEAIIFSDLGDTETDLLRAAARGSRQRWLVRTLFCYFDEAQQRWFLSRPKCLTWFAGVAGVYFFLTFFVPLRPNFAQSAQLGLTAQEQPVPLPSAEAVAPSGGGAPDGVPADIAAQTVQPGSSSQSDPPEPSYADPTVPTDSPAEPAPPVNELQGMQAYGRANEAASLSLSVYSRSQGATDATDAEASSAAAQQTEATSGQKPLESLRVYSSGAERPVQTQGVTPADDPFARPSQTPPSVSAAPVMTPTLPSGGAADIAPATPTAAYQPGDTVQATLEVGVATTGAAVQVLARDADESVWQGTATLQPSGRLDLTFTQVTTRAGQTQTLQAVALDAEGYAGLKAAVQETTPSLASDLVRGSLQGVANQVETLRDRRDVTIVDGVPVVSEVPPSVGESVAGAVADLFAGQDANDNVLVRVYTLPKHSPLTLMVLQ